MVTLHSYPLAVLLCGITMICWGSWANLQKLTGRRWRFELFYMDFISGLSLTSLLAALTLGSLGSTGRPFLADLAQADPSSIGWALLGGTVWSLGTLLLVAAIAVAGMAVGFPIGGGVAWVLGIVLNFALVIIEGKVNEGNSYLLFAGTAVIVVAIGLTMKAYGLTVKEAKHSGVKGVMLSAGAGVLIAFFYSLVVRSIDPACVTGGSGRLMPLTASFFFALGALLSTAIFNPVLMRHPVEGPRVFLAEYRKGSIITHSAGLMGGAIWSIGITSSFVAVGVAGPAVSYALSNAAPVVAILWGVFAWREFAGTPRGVGRLLGAIFTLYLLGLGVISYSRVI
jgi:glucose uptake protein